ncbi:50S ribosomal protein L29 [Candidatus Peribacteria bacterium RIFCSPLOWO2_01_FULL_51_18]|nr:MAG: 50S ribosomal protein L29 [Candidatus Peribacteria bacterium RIFCSPHIGHO2_02_FULL_51_15]OGJ65606.1 MAG: 50S ribosomal protein L29 [Candidatus Peribacteria bacterium RIFCSPLOWO2_01_FULL_51_18]OGJ69256.1 MAG: 50S ribosomal protein L29 [Candidatus Peribacteria bacterium RIFCSPLOWO2_02_FULL_51_10]
MSTESRVAELMRMSPDELRKEICLRRAECAKMRMGIGVQSEKNHALYRTKRRELARMLTVLGQLDKDEKNETKKTIKKTKKIMASQATDNAVKNTGSEIAAKSVVTAKSRKSSSSS